jgi:methionine-rich copper-binding protein CopC
MSCKRKSGVITDIIVLSNKEETNLTQKLYIIKISLLGIVLFVITFSIMTNISFLPVYCHPKPFVYAPQPTQIFDPAQSIPSKVVITFTERPELKASKIQVMDFKNERIDNHDLKLVESEKSLAVSLDKSKLMSGIYTVKWVVLSKDDGFITKGSYTFSIH